MTNKEEVKKGVEIKKSVKRPNAKKDYESSYKMYFVDRKKIKTELVNWRGGDIEFAIGQNYSIPKPPWYVVKITNPEIWSESWYDWLDYLGPPTVWLTRKRAEERAKELRQQYKCKIEVIKIEL